MRESKRKRQGPVVEVGGAGETQVADTLGGRMHVRWDEGALATPHGQLVFFAEFLTTAGVFERWVSVYPLDTLFLSHWYLSGVLPLAVTLNRPEWPACTLCDCGLLTMAGAITFAVTLSVAGSDVALPPALRSATPYRRPVCVSQSPTLHLPSSTEDAAGTGRFEVPAVGVLKLLLLCVRNQDDDNFPSRQSSQ